MSTTATNPTFEPGPFLKGFVALRRLSSMYPPGHSVVTQKVQETFQYVESHLSSRGALNIDIVGEKPQVNGEVCWTDSAATGSAVGELAQLGIHSLGLTAGLEPDELRRAAEFMAEASQTTGQPVAERLAAIGVTHISFGRIVALDTSWRALQWADGPSEPLHPSYKEALTETEAAFDGVAAGKSLDPANIRNIVRLLLGEVARSSAALAQILTLKEYENLTYCHSVNVAVLSWLIGRQLKLDEAMSATLVECALLHDVGKTRVPLAVVQKPGALDQSERKLIEAHTTFGAEILVNTPGVHPLAPTIALEHHRGVHGGGYPDLGDAIPHLMSQIVSVADIYEAITGARSYRQPMKPEQACLVLAREAGKKLNTAFVKAFVSAVTFFPLGSLVRTTRDELGVVIRTNPKDPLHPVIGITDDALQELGEEIDLATRDGNGRYLRHVAETITGDGRLPALLNRLAID